MNYKVFTTIQTGSLGKLEIIPRIDGAVFINIEDEQDESNSGYVILCKEDIISLSNYLIELINE